MRNRAADLFDKLDYDNSGFLDLADIQANQNSPFANYQPLSGTKLLNLARSAGIPTEFMATVLEQGDKDGDGYISREEFLTYMVDSERRLKEAFDRMDADGSGLLSKQEIESAMTNLELPCGGTTIKRVNTRSVYKLLDEMGVTDTHEVDYETFRYSVVTLSRRDLTTVSSYWSKCYVAGPYGDSCLDSGASTTDNSVGHMLGGFFAGVVAKTVSSPLEVVLRRIITGRVPAGSSLGRVMRVIIRDEGWRGLFKGNLGNVLKTPPTRFFELGFLQIFREMFMQPEDVTSNMAESPMAGALAGGCAMLLVYPLDTLSVRLSVTKNVYKGLGDALRRTIALETPRALFSGAIPTLLWAFPYMGIQYWILNRLERRYRNVQREALRRNRRPPEVNEHLRLIFHGTISSTTAAVVCMPFETCRRWMQVQTIGGRQRHYSTFLGAFGHLTAKHGLARLYVGVEVLALKTAVYSALSYSAYELAKAVLRPVLDRPCCGVDIKKADLAAS